MLNLDIRTLSFLAMLTSLLLAAGLLLVNRVITHDPALRLWARGAMAAGGGFILLALRGMIPDVFSIVVANTLIVMGYGRRVAGDVKLHYANPAAVRMFGARSFQALQSRPMLELIHPDFRQIALDRLKAALKTGVTNPLIEEKYLKLDGSSIDVEVRSTPILYDGQPAVQVTLNDITERKRDETALREQALELLRSNSELEQFSYAISHDLRQPLRMVSSYLQLLQRGFGDTLDTERREYFHFAIDGAKRMDQMLVSLLDYSRVGRKGEPLALMDSRDVVDEALHFLKPAIHEAHATVRVSGDWPQVLVSRNEFTRLWQNLIGNAIKYRTAGRAPEIDITVTPEAENIGWCFCVADNGIGIDPAQFERLFKVFQRLHTRDQYEGNGIGLAVARKIVERHGGRIWVESDGLGLGCRFYVTLPQQQEGTP